MYSKPDKKAVEVEKWVKRDGKTDEIIGIDPKAPANVKARYNSMVKASNSKKPIKK